MLGHHGVGSLHALGAGVDREACGVGFLDRFEVGGVQLVVSVGEASAPTVGGSQGAQGLAVDRAIGVQQVTADIVAPQAAVSDAANLGQEAGQIGATLTLGHLAPVDGLGACLGIAAAAVERAGTGAGLAGAGAGGDRTQLSVGADCGEGQVGHRSRLR